MDGAAWLSLTWALAMFSKGSSVYCADGIGACFPSWSRHRKFPERRHRAPATRRVHHHPSFAVSKLQTAYSLVRQHSDSELSLFTGALPALQAAHLASVSIRRSSQRSGLRAPLSDAWTYDRLGNLVCFLLIADCVGVHWYSSL